MGNYVDVKEIVWRRAHFKEGTNMESVIEVINKEGIDSIFDDELGFTENEILYDTADYIPLEDNGGDSTIEVYDNNEEIIWENGNNSN